jgi:hypothetical protein
MEQGTSQPKELSCMTPGGYEKNKWRIHCFREYLQTYTSALIFEYKDSKKTGINALINGVMRFDDPSPRISALHYSPANRNGKSHVFARRFTSCSALRVESPKDSSRRFVHSHTATSGIIRGRSSQQCYTLPPEIWLVTPRAGGTGVFKSRSTAGFRRNTFHCFYYHYSAFLKSRHKHVTGQQFAK